MAGLPWIQVASDWKGDKKAITLRVFLDDEWAWAYVVSLWMWTAQHAGDGVIEGAGSVAVIAAAAGWKGNPEIFADCLVRVGLLDERPTGYYVHDWHDYAGAHIEKREKERSRLRTYRERTRTPHVQNAYVPPADAHVHGERETETETEATTTTLALSPSVSPPPAEEQGSVFALLPCVGKGSPTYTVTETQITKWSVAYPGVDVAAEVRRAAAWLDANPTRRKTARGVPAFIVRWLTKAQDAPARPAVRSGPLRAVEPWEPAPALPPSDPCPLFTDEEMNQP